jgi:hypothetical protein
MTTGGTGTVSVAALDADSRPPHVTSARYSYPLLAVVSALSEYVFPAFAPGAELHDPAELMRCCHKIVGEEHATEVKSTLKLAAPLAAVTLCGCKKMMAPGAVSVAGFVNAVAAPFFTTPRYAVPSFSGVMPDTLSVVDVAPATRTQPPPATFDSQ